MKKISKIAKECGVTYREIEAVIKKEGIICDKKGQFKMVTPYQEELIHEILYFEGKIKEITLESKMNIPEPPKYQEPFEEFKKRTYGRR